MSTRHAIEILVFLLLGLSACLDDRSSSDIKELSEITITSAHDTLTAYFGEKFVFDNLTVEQSREELPLTYEWSYGNLNVVDNEIAPYPVKDSLRFISNDPRIAYTFRELGVFGLCLKVDNGETIRFKYFMLQVDTEFSEGITILSQNEEGKGRLSFMKTQSIEEVQAGHEPIFRTDIMETINPIAELEDVSDMIQANGRLLVASANASRIYNMDSRTFDLESMTSFKSMFPTCSFRSFAGISAQNNMLVLSDDKKVYVYDLNLDELVLTRYFADVDIDKSCMGEKPIFIDYGNSKLYAKRMTGLLSTSELFTPFDIHAVCYVGTKLYVVSTMKVNPLQVYLASISPSFSIPTILHFYTSPDVIKIDRDAICVGSRALECVFYTYENAVYRWNIDEKLPVSPVITVPEGMEITTLSMDPDEKLLYMGVYETNSSKELKGSLFVYDGNSYGLINTYGNVADRPVCVIYKKRV